MSALKLATGKLRTQGYDMAARIGVALGAECDAWPDPDVFDTDGEVWLSWGPYVWSDVEGAAVVGVTTVGEDPDTVAVWPDGTVERARRSELLAERTRLEQEGNE